MLVTTLEGRQTFGFSHAAAMFPSPPPVITMPPFTEIEFPLYLKPTSERFEDVVAAVMKSLRQPDTPLNTTFFSKANVDALQLAIRERISSSLGVLLDRQSDWELMLIMRRLYMETASNWPEDVGEEVSRLNSMVIQLSVDAISKNVTAYMTYRNKLADALPLPNPADSMTMTPYPSGPPVQLPDLNAEYELGVRAFRSTAGPLKAETAAPYAPSVSPETTNLNDTFERDLNAFRSTPLPPRGASTQAPDTQGPFVATETPGMPFALTTPPVELTTLSPF